MARKAASLELAVLGLLHESPLHGYELRKRLNLLLGWGRLLSYGSLYPALKRLLRAGWITEVTAPAAVSRRQRIVYQITPAGRQYFGEEITDDGPAAWEDDTSTPGSPSSPAPTPTCVCGSWRDAGPGSRSGSTAPGTPGGGDDRYLSELRRHSIESVEREVKWLGDLINAERTGRPAGAPARPRDHQRHQERRHQR